uniref:Uncharacterized protein n=1 Tax=Salarias fasciatus TaxID=181472 RepID=A0A672IJZ2_SALFA
MRIYGRIYMYRAAGSTNYKMASLCKRQQCTIDRRGFRQELDSWRHKLLHCVGFESILEGLFDPELVEDLKLFKGKLSTIALVVENSLDLKFM